MVIVGAMTRPEFADLRLDWGAVKRAAELAQLFRRGDNGLLVGLAAIFEREGFRIVGAHEIAPRLVAPSGSLGASDGFSGRRSRHRLRGPAARGAVGLRRGAGRGRRRRPGAGDRGRRGDRRDAGPGGRAARRRAPAAQRTGRRAGQGAEARTGFAARHAGGRAATRSKARRRRNCAGSRSPPAACSSPSASFAPATADAAGLFVYGFRA